MCALEMSCGKRVPEEVTSGTRDLLWHSCICVPFVFLSLSYLALSLSLSHTYTHTHSRSFFHTHTHTHIQDTKTLTQRHPRGTARGHLAPPLLAHPAPRRESLQLRYLSFCICTSLLTSLSISTRLFSYVHFSFHIRANLFSSRTSLFASTRFFSYVDATFHT